MLEIKNEKQIINKRISHNNSTPLLFENESLFNKNKFINNNSNLKNKKFQFRKKLSPLITTNFKLFNKKTKNNIYSNISILSSKNNNFPQINSIEKTKTKAQLSTGELAYENANNYMNKYFYPDKDESHEKSNKINEEIDINKIMTFYSKLKYNKEKEEINKIIKKQKKELIFSNSEEMEDNDYFFNNKNNLIPSFSEKALSKKNLNNLSNDTISNDKNISKKNFIVLDLNKKIYRSPLHSLDTMKKNKLIYDYIIRNYNNNRIRSYKGLENKLAPLLKLNSKKHNNIKILPFIQKEEESQYLLTNKNEEEGNKKNKSKNNINIENYNKEATVLDFSKILGQKKNEKYLLYNKKEYPNKNFPESRSEFIFAQEGREFILHGGYNVSRKYNLWKFNPFQNYWISIEPIGNKSEIRYAHTGVLHYRNLYIFGGINFRGTNFADLEIFSLDKKSWIFPRLGTNIHVPLRRNHVSCGVGNAMFIHGGINEENKYLDDFYIFNYKLLKWEYVDVDYNNKIKVPPLAHHSCCLVASEMVLNNSKFNIYNYPNIGRSRNTNNIREKGIYIFGGKISNEGPINNILYVLKIGNKPVEWGIINTYGNPPCPRYDSSLNFYERGNMLIIHGGRKFKNKKEYGLNDTFILDLSTFNWVEVEYFNKNCKVPRRYFHKAIIIKGELFIFGGINENEYIGSEMLILDLNSNSKCLKEKTAMIYKTNKQNNLLNDNNNQIENKKDNINNEKINKLKRIKLK